MNVPLAEGVAVFFAVLRKDLLRKLRSPLATIALLAFPVLFSILIGLVFGTGGSGGMAPIRVAVVDQDGGMAARLVRASLDQDRMSPRFHVVQVDSAAGIRLVDKNRVSALIRIPPGFSDSVFAARSTYLEVVKNPAQGIYPEIAEEYARVVAALGGSVLRVLGEPIREIRRAFDDDAPPTDLFIAAVSVSINRTMTSVGRYAFPPAIRLERDSTGNEKEDRPLPLQIALMVLPGMAVFSLFLMALVSVSDLHREAARGTLARQLLAPIPAGAVLAGKLAATGVVALAMIVILAVLAAIWAGPAVPVAGFALLSIAVALAATGLAALVHSVFRSERAAAGTGSVIVMGMSMISGSFIPLEFLPSFARAIAPWTLNYWAVQGYQDLLFHSASVRDLALSIGILGAAGLLLTAAALARLRRRFGG